MVKHTLKKYCGVNIVRLKLGLTTLVNIKYDIYKTQKKAVLKFHSVFKMNDKRRI